MAPNQKSELYLLHGRALNASPEYSSSAEEMLGRATRFNLPDAWNELGECLYKKGDFAGALTCFQKALKLVRVWVCWWESISHHQHELSPHVFTILKTIMYISLPLVFVGP